MIAFLRVVKYRRRNECRVCGARWPYVSVSARGLCPDHTRIRQHENVTQLREHRGPYFDHWRERTLAAFGVGLERTPS